VIESYDANYDFGNNKYLEIDFGVLLPYTLTPGSSLEVTVGLATIPILPKGYVGALININTSLGERTVLVEILDTVIDCGLYTSETVYYMDEPNLVVGVTNGNTGTNTPIEITSITEDENPTGVPYLIIEPTHTLPYSLPAGENFLINLSLNADKATEELWTNIRVQSSQNTITLTILIDEGLLSVTEITTETKLFPNPTSGQFTVEGADIARVEVYNLVGQKVYSEQGKVVSIDASEWNKGIYLVAITNNNGAIETKKLVVK
jgi:hypothetical protein